MVPRLINHLLLFAGALGCLATAASGAAVTLVDAKTRNGSFEVAGKGVPAWQIVTADCEATVTNAPASEVIEGKKCLALHSVVSSARSAFGYIVNHIPLREANGPHFELEWTAWGAQKSPYLGRQAQLVFFNDKSLVRVDNIDQGKITTKPQRFRVVHTTQATGWDKVELRLLLIRHGQPGDSAEGFIDAVTFRQSKELPKPTNP